MKTDPVSYWLQADRPHEKSLARTSKHALAGAGLFLTQKDV
jgi:hypothetical protein